MHSLSYLVVELGLKGLRTKYFGLTVFKFIRIIGNANIALNTYLEGITDSVNLKITT